MEPIIIRCPVSGALVQITGDEAPANENEFKPFDCPACRRMHLVNSTGKLIGETVPSTPGRVGDPRAKFKHAVLSSTIAEQ